ncbi:hypothetical protein [Novosphingobium sp. TCA1]|uniref:hypothetical protein n=1 Tax=Novosphingobium sp. TCA1 TaxID=2682474 RepID=UPI001306B559|nr:hypothetical protein [Novosphingobium sp. TCA1]GFE72362.1 hypothetical protein NTCA1_00110 [Novosphingobium sp. TCA1]
MASWFKNGTISVTNGSDLVTGFNTGFNSSIKRGDTLVVRGLNYEIDGVVNGSQLKLVLPFEGPTASNLSYGIKPENVVADEIIATGTTLIDRIADLIESGGGGSGGAGTPGKSAYQIWLDAGNIGTQQDFLNSLKGADGEDGQDGVGGEVELGALVDVTELAGTPVGGTARFLVLPVAEGVPNVTLTQSSTVMIPKDTTSMGAALYLSSTASNWVITLGLMNVPTPQPEVPQQPIDLSGESTLYASFNAITPLGITLNGATGSFVLSRNFNDAQLKVRRKWDTDIVTVRGATWQTGATGSPYPVTGTALPSAMVLNGAGEGTRSYANGRITLGKHAYLKSPALGLEFKSSSNPETTQTPPSVRLHFTGNAPAATLRGIMIGRLQAWGGGAATHSIHWNEKSIEFYYAREGGGSQSVLSDELETLTGRDLTIETEWVDDASGPGGTVTFFVNGAQYGAAKPTEWKPRITPAADFQVNASVDNTADSADGLVVQSVGMTIGFPDVLTTYTTIADGAVSAADIENLVLDATGVTTQQPEYTLSYVANGNQQFDLKLIVGEMVLPAGRAYKAVLEDWSTGIAVPHARELIMTRPAAQNCRFEDTTLFSAQGSWTEVVPQGPAPIIDGIRYGCEGIRQGNYVMFQFVYSQDYPASPFGDPTGLNTYMRPHKWMIYDNAGTLIARVEKPNGEPLNAASTKPVWEGQYDGRSVPQITDNNRWYPHGTVRSSVIWRSHDPVAYGQAFINQHLPVFDNRAKDIAAHTGFSVNGFDPRIFTGSAGGDGQSNGFANHKVMPWNWGEYNYETIKQYAANTKDPYKNLYTDISVTPNAALWLKYTPFNTMGRSPVVGPGGTRDDRQIIPEIVARYMRDVTSVRAHDERPMLDLCVSYLTGYASDPFNSVVNGKITPLYRGNARRNITMRNHYYGPGEATTPADQAWYAQLGRLSEWTTGQNPLRCGVPGNGKTADRPYFGGFEIDALHAHQFPHWGSLLFQTPEFAMIGVNFTDQVRMYDNSILQSGWGPTGFSAREQAWKFLHAALLWKTASSNSTRLYSRAEAEDWFIWDLELFYDQWLNSDPGFLRPPTNVMNSDGSVNGNLATLAGAAKFGPCYYTDGTGLELSEFQAGYWLSAIHAAHKLGFLNAMSAKSEKVAAVINWLKIMHKKHIIGRINDAIDMNMAGSDYQVLYWKNADVVAAGGDVSKLPQSIKAAADKYGRAPSWDTFTITENGTTRPYSRDGQAMDALLAGAALLVDMGMSGDGLEEAVIKSEQLFQQKLTSETAKGYATAGDSWFKYHQTTNNRPYKP